MDIAYNWRQIIATRLPAHLEESAIDFDDADIGYIETEMGKIGTISHDEVDIARLQNLIVSLLGSKTKDMRLFAHLLNTMQRRTKIAQIVLAMTLLADYIEIYWHIAPPQQLKKRIIKMIVQRFLLLKNDFYAHATNDEINEFALQAKRVHVLLQEFYEPICVDIKALIKNYDLANQDNTQDETSSSTANSTASIAASKKVSASELEPKEASSEASSATTKETTKETIKTSSAGANISASSSNNNILDKETIANLHKTVRGVITLEMQKDFYQPIIFRLRRHLVWSSIESVPYAQNQITAVPSIGIEKISSYEREFANADINLWQKIETTISYSPYWFDGHYMSAQIAHKLGYANLAQIIKQELLDFLQRFAQCKTLCCSDGSPFASKLTLDWLDKKPTNMVIDEQYSKVLNIYEAQGLTFALDYLEQITTTEPRLLFHTQLLTIKLLKKAGFSKIASQQLDALYSKVVDLSAKQWEPSFFAHLNSLKQHA